MNKVLERLKYEKYTLLICEREEREQETKRLLTNIGYIDKPDFTIPRSYECFSKQQTTDVVIINPKDCNSITQIKFIVDWDDIDDILYEGTKEQILGLRCPECGGNIKYIFSTLGDNKTRFTTECINCHEIIVRHKGPMPNCVKFFGSEKEL